jgi:hypothetical protein
VCKSYQIAGICLTYSTMINELHESFWLNIAKNKIISC